MKNRTMTLEQAYRYVLRRVDRETRKDARFRLKSAKRREKFQFVAWDSYDEMSSFIAVYGNGKFEETLDGKYRMV